MQPRLALRTIPSALAAVCLAVLGVGVARGEPNVVLFFVDDMGYADWEFDANLNPTGSLVYETPNMLRLAEQGVTFSNGYSASPVCSPARAALMSGKSAGHIGITDFIGANSDASGDLVQTTDSWIQNIPDEEVLLSEALREGGYRTAFFGKWHLGEGNNPAADPLRNGFEENVAGVQFGNPGFAGGFFAGADGAWAGMPGLDEPGTYDPDDYLSDVLAGEASAYISDRAAADEPFFLMMSHYVVHTPIEAPADLVAYYTDKIAGLPPGQVDGHANAAYAAMVQKMDESLGRLLDALEDPDGDPQTDDGILDETIVIFTSDNGGLTNWSVTSNRPLREGKGSIHEGGIREPLIFSYTGNGGVARGRVVDAPATGYDLYPTILEWTGVEGDPEQNASMDGVSLVDLLEGRAFERGDLYWHYPHRSPQSTRPPQNLPVDGGRWAAAVRRGNMKLVYFFDERRFELYDVVADIDETDDLFPDDPMAAASMSRSLYGHLRRVDAPMPRDLGSGVELPGPGFVAPAEIDAGDALFTDAFDEAHDFRADGVEGTEWDGVLNPASAAVFDRDTTTPDALTFRNSGQTRLVAGDISAPVVYEEVTGDFEAVMRIGSMEDVNFHVLAMLVQDPGDPEGDFLWVGQQDRAGDNDFAQARNIVGGSRVGEVGENGVYEYYRLVREGDSFIGFFSSDGVVWVPFVEFERPDMPETVRLGLTQALFGSTPATGTVERFQIIPACEPDIADPIGRLDERDVSEFLHRFSSDDPSADIAEPFGQRDFFDVLAYLSSFDEGCI